MFHSVLVANRGEIACRVMRAARSLGMRTVAIYSDADSQAVHTQLADEAIHIGGSPVHESYGNAPRIIGAAEEAGVDALHPGYGFLAENADFAEMVLSRGITWVGPDPQTMRQLGDKSRARDIVSAAGFPVSRGVAVRASDDSMAACADLGFPVILKPSAGGGGIGMRVIHEKDDLASALEAVQRQAGRLFGSQEVLVEPYLAGARHIEIQILGLADGRIITLGERDCSIQRRYQKVIEEAPSPGMSADLRRRMSDAVVEAARAVGYRNAGTFECLVADDRFMFLEVNTRLQVEHPITEEVTGVDLVAAQFRIAAGEPVELPDRVETQGHAIELRVCAEDPDSLLPRPGRIDRWEPPNGPGVRVDSGFRAGDEVTPFYDPLLAKLIVSGSDREQSIERATAAVDTFVVEGIVTNLPFHARLLRDERFARGDYSTTLVSDVQSKPRYG